MFSLKLGECYAAMINSTDPLAKISRDKFLLHKICNYNKDIQDAQLSQRDRTAGCVIVFAKSGTLELGDNILRTL